MEAYVQSECGRGRSVPSYVTACCALQSLVEAAAAPSGVLKLKKGKAKARRVKRVWKTRRTQMFQNQREQKGGKKSPD